MEPPPRDWFDWALWISSVVGALSAATASFFAFSAFRADRSDRVEREKPFLAARTGVYQEAPEPEPKGKTLSLRALSTNPANKAEPILINVGNGPALDLSIMMHFQLCDEAETLPAQKFTGSYTDGGVLGAGDYVPTHKIVDLVNNAFFSGFRSDLKDSIDSGATYDFSLKINIEAKYRDKGKNPYTQTIDVVALVKTYFLSPLVNETGNVLSVPRVRKMRIDSVLTHDQVEK